MQTDTVSIEQFIKDNRISMTAERVDKNPNMDDSRDMDHWKCLFSRRTDDLREGYDTWHGYKGRLGDHQYHAKRMTTYFSQGYGHNGVEPKAADVLDCLASDASSVENTSFEDWCDEMGWDSDSRKAERTYKACQHGAKRLKAFLGDDLYQTLLYGTERM